eukprot:TRINITY_DN39493_c0_g1_i1.p1 TRINITY_DN39493_c0_g1~~TRINITY_DN39493_c0_g1_i1.p1  ORF type:complete len:149 (+),score=16.21 TRINITY_DN39493_c0_g1_i1:135-581(+)
MNFGKWQTQQEREFYDFPCHGHAHIILTRHAISRCTDDNLKELKGRVEDPDPHLVRDCKRLQQEHLFSFQIRHLENIVKAQQQAILALQACINGKSSIDSNGGLFALPSLSSPEKLSPFNSPSPVSSDKIGRAVQQECRDRSRMPSSA